jgi:putative MATE family efflux protein
MSTTAMVARRTGEKDLSGAATAAAQAILFGLALAVLMGVPGVLLAPRILGWMGATPAVVATGQHFTAVSMASSYAIMLLFLNNAIFRGAGDASVAMRVLWFSNLINVVLDPLLIFGWGPFPQLGVTGAAVATLIGRSAGVVYQFHILLGGRSRVVLRWSDFRIVPSVLASLARVSVTGVLQFAIAHTSWIALVRMISEFGSAAVAGYTIGIRIFVFMILPSWGFSGAAATMVGQNLGAKKPHRAVKAVYTTATYNAIFLAGVAALFIFMPGTFVGFFTGEPEVARYAVDCLRIVAYGNIAYAFGMVMVQAFNGAGDTVTPTMINLVGFWMCQIPLAWTLAFGNGLAVTGVFWSIPLAELLITLMGLSMFMRGKWKEQKI